MNLLLIESPGKLKKLSQILGAGWIVKASMGHIRELANDGEDALGFDLEGDRVNCRYEPRGSRAQKVLKELRDCVKRATNVYIATDPDREGETIGWHLMQELKLKQPKRVTYSEITSSTVRAAINNPRTIDQHLVAAGRARDCLDKLVGYKGSKHVVWALNNGAKSMGRVQSATLHLLCLRENEILVFVPQDYWSIWVEYREGFKAFYRGSLEPSVTPGGEPDDAGSSKPELESDRVSSQAEADRLVAIAKAESHHVVKVEQKVTNQSPPAPFITSTLQQAAGAKLRFTPEQTMKVAQSLYEAGHITYMRTDSVVLSEQFCAAVRQYLEQHDPDNVPTKVARHYSKAGAQEAHEAIRPTDVYAEPEQMHLRLTADQAKLYELIWNRAVASQCAPAKLAKTRIVTQSGSVFWEARGQVLTFPGYTRYWNNISADSQLPNVQQGQSLTLKQADSEQKQTQPPPRYTEPKLVQLMERKGIGRPSTYSPTIKTLKEREYVQLLKGKLQPTQLGMELDTCLERVLPDLIQPEFTAQMEAQLDAIATGKLEWERYLTSWHRDYFAPALDKAIANIHASKGGGERGYKKTRETKKQSPREGRASAAQQRVTRSKEHTTSSQRSSSASPPSGQRSETTRPAELTAIQCPNCGHQMKKVFSKSKKLKADHFLSCDQHSDGCGAVMFLNVKSKNYELPYAKRPPVSDPEKLTEHPCPVCRKPLECYEYSKNGESKVMLRCSNFETKQSKCKEVAFFKSKGEWWSPKFGEIKV